MILWYWRRQGCHTVKMFLSCFNCFSKSVSLKCGKGTSLLANINIGKVRLIVWHKLMFASADTGLILFCSGFYTKVSTILIVNNMHVRCNLGSVYSIETMIPYFKMSYSQLFPAFSQTFDLKRCWWKCPWFFFSWRVVSRLTL